MGIWAEFGGRDGMSLLTVLALGCGGTVSQAGDAQPGGIIFEFLCGNDPGYVKDWPDICKVVITCSCCRDGIRRFWGGH